MTANPDRIAELLARANGKVPRPWMRFPGLSNRVQICLARAKIETAEQLLAAVNDGRTLQTTPGIGDAAIREICAWLAERFPADPPAPPPPDLPPGADR